MHYNCVCVRLMFYKLQIDCMTLSVDRLPITLECIHQCVVTMQRFADATGRIPRTSKANGGVNDYSLKSPLSIRYWMSAGGVPHITYVTVELKPQ